MSLLKLQQMIDSGSTFYYRNQPAVIKSFDTVHNEIQILIEIDGQPQMFIKENEEKIDLFLACFKTIPIAETDKSNLPGKNQTSECPLIYTETKEYFKTLTNTLLADIEKVRQEPQYVAQAKQVCNNVSEIVNITKLQLQLLKEG